MHRWTDEERLYVRREYKNTVADLARIADHLGVTSASVKAQVGLLGLGHGHGRLWTTEEIETLTGLLFKYSTRTVARMLHRTEPSIKYKARRLHYSRRIKDGWFCARELADVFGVSSQWVINRIHAGVLRARPHTDGQPGRFGSTQWHIDAHNIVTFIRSYPQELNDKNLDMITIIELLVGIKEPSRSGRQ